MSDKWGRYEWMLVGLLMLGPILMSREVFYAGAARFGFIALCATLATLLVEQIRRW